MATRKTKKSKKVASLGVIAWLAFFASLADAVSAYVQSSFLKQFLSLDKISILIGIAAFSTFFVSLYYPRLINKLNNYHCYLATVFVSLVSSLVLAMSQSTPVIIFAFLIRYICLIMILVNLDIFLESRSDDKNTGRIRSRYLTVLNVAYLASPLLMGWLVGYNQYVRTFYFSFWLMAISVFLAFIFNRSLHSQKIKISRHKTEIIKPLQHIWRTDALRKIFITALILQIFYSLAVLYVPMHLHDNLGISWSVLGKVFTIMLLPFLLFQYPAGVLADKYWGEKELLFVSSLILASACIIIPLVSSHSALFWAILLFYSRIGAAVYEAMQETYFYKHVNSSDISLITMFRQTRSVGWMLGSIIAFVFLQFTTIAWLFAGVAALIIANLYNVLSLKDTK